MAIVGVEVGPPHDDLHIARIERRCLGHQRIGPVEGTGRGELRGKTHTRLCRPGDAGEHLNGIFEIAQRLLPPVQAHERCRAQSAHQEGRLAPILERFQYGQRFAGLAGIEQFNGLVDRCVHEGLPATV